MTENVNGDHRIRESPFKVLLVEDNPADALLLECQIKGINDFSLRKVEKLSQAMDCLEFKDIDVILLDLNLPDATGLEGLIKLRRKVQTIPIVILTGVDDEELGIMALQRGAQDYLVKGVDYPRLAQAIRYAIERMRNRSQDSSTGNEDEEPGVLSGIGNNGKQGRHQIFTERELQTLKLVGKGYSNQEIADALTISITTVKTHITNILQKLAVPDRTKAIVEAIKQHLI